MMTRQPSVTMQRNMMTYLRNMTQVVASHYLIFGEQLATQDVAS